MAPTRSLFDPGGRTILTVSQITGRVKETLDAAFDDVWVKGEISNFKAYPSGHWYFSLKDAGAQLSAVLFKGSQRAVRALPRDGLLVLVHGRIGVYEARGAYQIVVDSMEDLGQGRLQAEFEALKARLEEEGLFRADLKRPLPFLPARIALVTSPQGAAVRDLIRVITRRMPNASLVVVPTAVQGEEAPLQIVNALKKAALLPQVEVIVVGRGGGSLEDLWAFNDERVARAIRASPLPVVSAVGHEVDFTMSDFVADVRAATPSQAGELVVPDRRDLDRQLHHLAQRLRRGVLAPIERNRLALHRLSARLKRPDRRIYDQRLRLDDLTHRLLQAPRERLDRARQRTAGYSTALLRHSPIRRLGVWRQRLASDRLRLTASFERRRGMERERVRIAASTLHALSPLTVLGRGYSYVTDEEGRVLTDAARTAPGRLLLIHPSRGEVAAQVISIATDPPPE